VKYIVVPPTRSISAWWKVVLSEGNLMNMEVKAMLSPDLPGVEKWAELIAEQSNRGLIK
jgi:hypothetical protein